MALLAVGANSAACVFIIPYPNSPDADGVLHRQHRWLEECHGDAKRDGGGSLQSVGYCEDVQRQQCGWFGEKDGGQDFDTLT